MRRLIIATASDCNASTNAAILDGQQIIAMMDRADSAWLVDEDTEGLSPILQWIANEEETWGEETACQWFSPPPLDGIIEPTAIPWQLADDHPSPSASASTSTSSFGPLALATPSDTALRLCVNDKFKRNTEPFPSTQPTTRRRRGKPRARPAQSHRSIERRYRSKLVDLIDELCLCVPTLKAFRQGIDSLDLDGLTPARKWTRAVIFEKATEYIKHLEAKRRHWPTPQEEFDRAQRLESDNKELQKNIAILQGRLDDIERVLQGTGKS